MLRNRATAPRSPHLPDSEPLALAPTLPGGLLRRHAMGAIWARLCGREPPLLRVGRYEIESRLAAGGMGEVFVAHDVLLDRRVALKVLRERDPDDRAGTTTLLTEARAAASVRHPNVIEIFDVGLFEGRVFIAMELVEGPTLAQWVGDRPDTSLILEALRQAGAGLAAAHDAGLVHRDFKPHNVVLELDPAGAPRRARVVDFGLASDVTQETDEGDTERTVMGTPLYMAPEQRAGRPTDGRCDQFAFCVSAWECLFGAHPRAGDGATGAVPARVRRALQRGMARDPAARWPSMPALLRQLRPRAVGRGLALGTAAAGIAMLTAFVATAPQHTPTACETARSRAESVWSPQRRERVRQALADNDAGPATERIAAHIDTHMGAWLGAHAETCEAAEADRGVFDRRITCLGGDLARVDAFLGELETIDRAGAEALATGPGPLPPPSACTRADASGDDITVALDRSDPTQAELADAIDQAWAMGSVGKFGEAGPILARAETLAQQLGHREALATVLLLDARRAAGTDVVEASRDARDAYYLAKAVGRDAIALHAAVDIVDLEVNLLEDPDEGARWCRLAEAELERSPSPNIAIELAVVRAGLHRRTGRTAEAKAELEAALQAAASRRAPDDPYLARVLGELATVEAQRGDYAAALALLERALDIIVKGAGKQSRQYAHVVNNIAATHYHQGRLELAVEEWTPLLDRLADERRSPNHASLLRNVGLAEYGLERYEDALGRFEAALSLVRDVAPDHPLVGTLLVDVAGTRAELGDLDTALGEMDEAVAHLRHVVGPEHPDFASAVSYRADVLARLGRMDEARAARRAALATLVAALGPLHPQLASLRLVIARDLVLQGRVREAIPLLEAGVDGYARRYRADSEEVGALREELARARAAARGEAAGDR